MYESQLYESHATLPFHIYDKFSFQVILCLFHFFILMIALSICDLISDKSLINSCSSVIFFL